MTEEIKHSNWKLRKGQIIAARQMTATEKWFDIKLEDWSLDHEPGQFVAPHTVAVDSHGDVYVGEVLEGKRVQKFVRK